MELRAWVERRDDVDRRIGGRVLQQIGQVGIVKRMAVDRSVVILRLVVAEAVQRGLEAASVVARPRHQRERPTGAFSRSATSCEAFVQRLVERAVAGRLQRDVVRLRDPAPSAVVRTQKQ